MPLQSALFFAGNLSQRRRLQALRLKRNDADPVWFEVARHWVLRIGFVTGPNCRGARDVAEEGSFDLLAAVVRPLEALEDVVEIAASKGVAGCRRRPTIVSKLVRYLGEGVLERRREFWRLRLDPFFRWRRSKMASLLMLLFCFRLEDRDETRVEAGAR